MRHVRIALVAVCLAASFTCGAQRVSRKEFPEAEHGQSVPPAESEEVSQVTVSERSPYDRRLIEVMAPADAFYGAKRYTEAAATLKPFLSAREGWSFDWYRAMYELACYESLAGDIPTGLAALRAAQSDGNLVDAAQLTTDPDLAALRKAPDFAEIVDQARRREPLWRSEPAQDHAFAPNLSVDDKVAALSTLWSEARFNFAFFDRHPDLNWNQLYLEYLPRVRATRTTAEFYRVLMQFFAELKDGHSGVYPPDALADTFYAAPGLRTELIEGRVVITDIRDKTLADAGWRIGDIITKIDGIDVREYAESEIAPYISASTPQDRDVRVYSYSFLAGDAQVALTLTVQDAAGHLSVRRVQRIPKAERSVRFGPARPDASFSILPSGVAYLAVNEFENDAGLRMLLANIERIRLAKGLLIDIRRNGGGDSEFGHKILQVLASKPFYDSISRTPLYRAVDRAHGGTPKTTVLDQDVILPDPAHHLDVPVAVLAGPNTYSAAEDFIAAYLPMHRGLLVGQPTGGSTGQPFSFHLPGGGTARVCTKNDIAADGTQFEGVGFSPDILVRSTIADIQGGRDRAIDIAAAALAKVALH